MRFRTLSGLLLTALAALPIAARAEDPKGRARTWDLEANIGMSVLDTGFDRKLLGYTLTTPPNGTSKVPETRPDHLTTLVPTFGLRAGYNFTRFLALEASATIGETEVADGTYIKLEENFSLNPSVRKAVLNQQTAAAPGILAAYDSLKFDYTSASLVSVFKFNNRASNRWVFYGTFGGGYYGLNTNTGAFNDCAGGEDLLVYDPTAPIYNGDPNAFEPDLFPDNPDQLVVRPNCGRAFPTATQVRVEAGSGEPVLVMGSIYQDADAWLTTEVPNPNNPNPNVPTFPGCGTGTVGQIYVGDSRGDPVYQFTCDGVPQWQVEPGSALATPGFATTGKVRSIENLYWALGGGVRWHIRPRQVLRFDAKRYFDENNNKNINEFTVGYSFVVGRGKPDNDAAAAVPAPAESGDGTVPPPAGDDGLG